MVNDGVRQASISVVRGTEEPNAVTLLQRSSLDARKRRGSERPPEVALIGAVNRDSRVRGCGTENLPDGTFIGARARIDDGRVSAEPRDERESIGVGMCGKVAWSERSYVKYEVVFVVTEDDIAALPQIRNDDASRRAGGRLVAMRWAIPRVIEARERPIWRFERVKPLPHAEADVIEDCRRRRLRAREERGEIVEIVENRSMVCRAALLVTPISQYLPAKLCFEQSEPASASGDIRKADARGGERYGVAQNVVATDIVLDRPVQITGLQRKRAYRFARQEVLGGSCEPGENAAAQRIGMPGGKSRTPVM